MAPKRAFGGVLRPFGGGFRGPNRERASVFSGAGRAGRRGLRCRRGGPPTTAPAPQRQQRGQRVLRRGTGRCRWFCSGARRRSQRVQRRGTECSAVEPGAGRGGQDRPPGGKGTWPVDRRPAPPKAAAGCKADGRAAGTKKRVPRERSAAAGTQKELQRKGEPPPEHIRAQKNGPRSVHFYSATLRASAPGCSSDTPCRTTTVPHSGSPSLLRATSGSMSSCNSLSAFDFGLPVGRGHSSQPSGSQQLSRSGRPRCSPPSGPPLLFASAAGISAPAAHRRQPEFQPPQPPGPPPLLIPPAGRGHSTTTSVWPSTCSWRISCVELT